jgi:hypothetical protein
LSLCEAGGIQFLDDLAGPNTFAGTSLSDVKLAETLDVRSSFRRFCEFSASEPTPERTSFVRFRKALIAHGLGQVTVRRDHRRTQGQGAVQVRLTAIADNLKRGLAIVAAV